jgi:hypothetical protein
MDDLTLNNRPFPNDDGNDGDNGDDKNGNPSQPHHSSHSLDGKKSPGDASNAGPMEDVEESVTGKNEEESGEDMEEYVSGTCCLI